MTVPDDREQATQREVAKDAAKERDDATTSREEAELHLMDAGESEAGEELGDQID